MNILVYIYRYKNVWQSQQNLARTLVHVSVNLETLVKSCNNVMCRLPPGGFYLVVVLAGGGSVTNHWRAKWTSGHSNTLYTGCKKRDFSALLVRTLTFLLRQKRQRSPFQQAQQLQYALLLSQSDCDSSSSTTGLPHLGQVFFVQFRWLYCGQFRYILMVPFLFVARLSNNPLSERRSVRAQSQIYWTIHVANNFPFQHSRTR